MCSISKKLIPEEKRTDHTAMIFGLHFPLSIEPAVFHFASLMSADYSGGYWRFHELGNGGFYMAPDDDCFDVVSENGWTGAMSADAFGITCCLYAYSHLAFSGNENLVELCARHFHLLRGFAMDHAEVGAILGATD